MMRKLLLVLLSVLLVVSLGACSKIKGIVGDIVKKGTDVFGGNPTAGYNAQPTGPDETEEPGEPTPKRTLKPTPAPTPEPTPEPTPLSPGEFTAAVESSVLSRLENKDYESVAPGKAALVPDFIEFAVDKVSVFNADLYDNIKYVDVVLLVRKADTVGSATIVGEDFMLRGEKNGEVQYAFPALWYVKNGDFKEFPIVLETGDAVKVVLSFKVHGDFMRDLLIQTNVFMDGTAAGPLYVVNVKS